MVVCIWCVITLIVFTFVGFRLVFGFVVFVGCFVRCGICLLGTLLHVACCLPLLSICGFLGVYFDLLLFCLLGCWLVLCFV